MAGIKSITQRPAWQALAAHYPRVKELQLRTLFAEDPSGANA